MMVYSIVGLLFHKFGLVVVGKKHLSLVSMTLFMLAREEMKVLKLDPKVSSLFSDVV